MEDSGRQCWTSRFQLLDDDDLEVSSDSELETSGLRQDSPEGMLCCLNCSSNFAKKRLSLARSKQFCSPQCMQERQTKKNSKTSMSNLAGGSKRVTRSSSQTTLISVSAHSPEDIRQLPARMRKNLYIDMAPPGSTLPHPVDSEEEPYSWVATPPTATTQTASSARNENKGSHHKRTRKSEIERPRKRRRTEPLKQIQKTEKKVRWRRKRCGKCEACCRDDCGKCIKCRDKKKFGGKGILRKPCIYRVCKRLKCKREKKKKKRLIFKRGTHSSSASESEQEDSIGNEAEREVPLDSQEKEAVESDGTVGYSDCPSESESVMSDSMLVTIPYPLVHQQPSKSSIGNHSLFPTEASKGRSAITCARSTPTVEESNCSPNIQDSEEVDDIGPSSLQIDEIFTRFETHVHDVRAQLEEKLRQKESENTKLSKQLHAKEQASKPNKWLKAVALPKTSMTEQMKVVVKEHLLKVQEKMDEIAVLNEKYERQRKQLQEQHEENMQLSGQVKQQEEENTQLRRRVKQQKEESTQLRRWVKQLQEEISKLNETIEQLQEARRTDQKTIQEKEEKSKEIRKMMEKISTSLP